MSKTIVGSFPIAPKLSAAVLGDVMDFTTADLRFAPAYAVTTKPGGSVAAFSGASFTPDVAGSYVFTVTVGADVLLVPVSVFDHANVYAGLLAGDLASGKRTDATVRRVLNAICTQLTPAQFAAWNLGTMPPLSLANFGG